MNNIDEEPCKGITLSGDGRKSNRQSSNQKNSDQKADSSTNNSVNSKFRSPRKVSSGASPKKRQKTNKDDDDTDTEEDDIPTLKIFPFLYNAKPEEEKPSRIQGLKKRITESGMCEKDKAYVLSRLKNVDVDKEKAIEWFEQLLKIPFNQYATLPIHKRQSHLEISEYFSFALDTLDNAVYGLHEVKEDILNYVAQMVSTNNISQPRVIGLCGSAGIGKTVLIRRGLSEVLKRPMQSISMGGMRDISTFVGFEYTYSGARYGTIVQCLMEAKVMNPIIFMDEVDKVSMTHDGIDIQNLLIHMTDPVQNMSFQDKYFSGITIDISRAVFVFAFNDESSIHPILRDRIHIIRVPDPTLDAKVVIGQKYLLREICANVGFQLRDIVFSEEIIKYLIRHYCKKDKGVRGLKRCMESILLRINTARFLGKRQKYKELEQVRFPLQITEKLVRVILPEDKSEQEILSHMYL